MLKELRRSEESFEDGSKIAYLLQVKDATNRSQCIFPLSAICTLQEKGLSQNGVIRGFSRVTVLIHPGLLSCVLYSEESNAGVAVFDIWNKWSFPHLGAALSRAAPKWGKRGERGCTIWTAITARPPLSFSMSSKYDALNWRKSDYFLDAMQLNVNCVQWTFTVS